MCVRLKKDKPQSVNERYGPFNSTGWVSIGDHPEVEVGILRDTGANQSLILGSLIGDDQLLAGSRRVKVQGLLSESDMPKCAVRLKSDYL